MQSMSDSSVKCCTATTISSVYSCIGAFSGATVGFFYTASTGSYPMIAAELLPNLAIFAGVGTGVGFSLAACSLIYAVCSASNNAVDIENPPEKTNLLPAQDKVQATMQYGLPRGMFPPVAATGTTNSSVQNSRQEQPITPGLFPSSNLQ